MGEQKKISDEQFFRLLEGELSKQEETQLLQLIAADEELSAEWALWQMTLQEDENTIVFDGKEQLKLLTEERKGIIVLWPKIASIAAILVLGVICFWMLQDTEKIVKPQAKINADTIVKDNLVEDLSNLEVIENAFEKRDESKSTLEDNIKINKDKNFDGNNQSKTVLKKANMIITKVNSKDTLAIVVKTKVANIDTSSKVSEPKNNVISVAVQENAEVVYGTKKESQKLLGSLKRLLSFKNKIKNDLNEWIEKPQVALEGNKEDKQVSIKNSKIKLSIKQ